jgi:hypothetical protein
MNAVYTRGPLEDTEESQKKVYFVWPRTPRGYYNRVHPMAIFDGSILSGHETGEIEKMYGKKGVKMIEEYLEKKTIHLGDNVFDVKSARERYGILNGTALVESRKKIDFIRNRVKFIEVATSNSKEKRKKASFHHMYLSCDCKDNFQGSWFQRATKDVMKVYKDFRKPYDIPAPRIIMNLCAHTNATLNILVDKKHAGYFAEDFDMWGNNGHAVKTFKKHLDIALDETLPRWRKGEFFSFHTKLFNPWRKKLELPEVKAIA